MLHPRCVNEVRLFLNTTRNRVLLQRLLWQRLQGRCEARAQPALAAGFYNAIVSELEYSLGNRPACAAAGMPPRDPYDQARMFMDHVQDSSPVRKAPGQLQLEDVHILERFYNQLCLLVEAQCPSDPMSLLCVQHVRPKSPVEKKLLHMVSRNYYHLQQFTPYVGPNSPLAPDSGQGLVREWAHAAQAASEHSATAFRSFCAQCKYEEIQCLPFANTHIYTEVLWRIRCIVRANAGSIQTVPDGIWDSANRWPHKSLHPSHSAEAGTLTQPTSQPSLKNLNCGENAL